MEGVGVWGGGRGLNKISPAIIVDKVNILSRLVHVANQSRHHTRIIDRTNHQNGLFILKGYKYKKYFFKDVLKGMKLNDRIWNS